MGFAIALFLGVALLVVVLVGQLIWALFIVVPAYVYVAVAVYFVLRHRRQCASADAFIAQQAERERMLNNQEFRAWEAASESEWRNGAKRDAALRQKDGRKPPGT